MQAQNTSFNLSGSIRTYACAARYPCCTCRIPSCCDSIMPGIHKSTLKSAVVQAFFQQALQCLKLPPCQRSDQLRRIPIAVVQPMTAFPQQPYRARCIVVSFTPMSMAVRVMILSATRSSLRLGDTEVFPTPATVKRADRAVPVTIRTSLFHGFIPPVCSSFTDRIDLPAQFLPHSPQHIEHGADLRDPHGKPRAGQAHGLQQDGEAG